MQIKVITDLSTLLFEPFFQKIADRTFAHVRYDFAQIFWSGHRALREWYSKDFRLQPVCDCRSLLTEIKPLWKHCMWTFGVFTKVFATL